MRVSAIVGILFIDLTMSNINKVVVHEWTCLCTNSSNCTNCAKPKNYLVEQWVEFDLEKPTTRVIHRIEGRSLDYVQGFIEGLNQDNRTDSITLREIEE